MKDRKHDIYERIFQFIVLVIKFTRKTSRTLENKTIIAQLLRSVTSMGANSEEADGTQTKKDFTHCFTLVRKEGKESLFWIRLLGELNNVPVEPLLKEGNEIVAIVTAIIMRTKSHS